MKRLLLIAFVFCGPWLFAAFTNHYVTSTGTDTYANATSSSTPCSLATAIAGVAGGDCVNIKAGTYTISADLAFATAGTTTALIWWRGYKTAAGDLDTAGGSRIPATDLPNIATTNVGDQVTSAGAYQIFSNLSVASTCTDAGGAWNATGGNQKFIRCQIVNSTANAASRALTCATAGPGVFIGCRFAATTTATIAVSTNVITNFYGCYVSGGVTGITTAEYLRVVNCVFTGFATNGISIGAATRHFDIIGTTIYAASTNAILVTVLPTSGSVVIANCILGGCTNGVNNNVGTSTAGITVIATHFYNITNAMVGMTEQAAVTDPLAAELFSISNSTDPFVAKGSQNYTLTSSTTDKAAGYPGVFDDPSGTNVMTSYLDLGAVQLPSGGQTSSASAR